MPKDRETKYSASSLLVGRRRSVVGIAVLSLVGGLAEAVFLVVITRAAFAVTAGKEEFGILAGRSLSVAGMVWLALGLVVLKVGLSLIATWQSARLSSDVTADIRRQLASAFLRSSWSVQQGHRSGRLQEMLTNFAGAAATTVGSVTNIITSAFNLIALLGLSIVVDPAGSIAVVIAVALLGSVLRPVRAMVKRQSAKAARSGMDFASSLSEISNLGMEVHIFNVQTQTERRIATLIDENAVAGQRLNVLRGLVPNLYSGLAYLAIVAAIGLVAVSNTTNFTSLGAVMLIMLRSLSYGQGLQVAAANVSAAAPFVEGLHDQLASFREAAVIDHGEAIGEIGTLTVDAVCFEYTKSQPVLVEVTATIARREIVGIIGPSGSGKSTLVQLLLGLRQPTSGRVLADGRPIDRFSRSEWARRVAFVPQAAHLIAGTIADNIRFFRDDVSHADIERAARLAHLHADISTWPDGYGREVGEHGGHLSGGQQQRLCIARALVERPDVLILDEPTSSLDVQSESLIRETLTALRQDMSIVIIAHRLSTLEICDRIMVIQDGQLKAFDTPTNLEATSDFYRDALVLSGLR